MKYPPLNSYAQNGEDVMIWQYFKNKSKRFGSLLEIGANDGKTLSNSLLFIEQGWSACLVEPSSAMEQLFELHKNNKNVKCVDVLIGAKNETVKFYESGAHVPGGKDKALVSTISKEEMSRWPGVEFRASNKDMITYDSLCWICQDLPKKDRFDYISIDVEGVEWDILQQIDLTHTDVLCVEWNGGYIKEGLFTDYCKNYGLALSHKNAENLIFTR